MMLCKYLASEAYKFIESRSNLGWKLVAVLLGYSPPALLSTYSSERQMVAKDLINFDKKLVEMISRKPQEATVCNFRRTLKPLIVNFDALYQKGSAEFSDVRHQDTLVFFF